MTSLLSSVLNPFMNLLTDHVFKHLCFSVRASHNVKSLERRAENVEAKRKDVLEKIQSDERLGKKATNEAEAWLRNAEDVQEKAQSIRSEYDNRNCMFPGISSCSFNCFSNYSIGKRAAEVLEIVEKLPDVTKITTEVLPPPTQEMSTATLTMGSGYEIESKLQMVLDFLRDDDDDAQGMLGLWGMGGVGKTTILERINNSLAKDPSAFGFHHVIFLIASKECTVEKIQYLLVKNLGLPGTEQIFGYLSKKSFVLLLDDLWEPLDLKQAGIPLPFGTIGQHKRKLILTTRSQEVCHNMDIHMFIEVQCLSPEAARHLFREKVGEDAINSHPLIAQLVDEVADECDGLPLALITIGRAMARNQTIQVWRNTAKLLRDSKMSKIPGMIDPFPLLKFSYDLLKDPTEQQCFLHCALWPEDAEIKKENLIQCWMGHGLLGEDCNDIQASYDKGHAIIHSLLKACLLERVGPNRWSLQGDNVKLHDVIRDMALWIARDCGKNENQWVVLDELSHDPKVWEEAHKMSVWRGEGFPFKIKSCSNLSTLILNNNYSLISSGMGVIKHFSALKYLDFRCSSLEVFPVEICFLIKLEYLNISNTRVSSLPEELRHLTNLKHLIARETEISMLPDGFISDLVNLLHLDLLIDDGYGYQPIFQSSIIEDLNFMGKGSLKALAITACTTSDLQNIVCLEIPIRGLCIREINGLTCLQLLSHDVLGMKHMHSTLKHLLICHSTIEEILVDKECYLNNLDYLHLNGLSDLKEIIWKGVEPWRVLPTLRRVIICDCSLLKHVSWLANLPCLEDLSLYRCKNMEHLIWVEVEIDEPRRLFSNLRLLIMKNLPNLISMCDVLLTFPTLEYFKILSCEELKRLPFESPPPSLREIEIDQDLWKKLEMDDDMRNNLRPFLSIY